MGYLDAIDENKPDGSAIGVDKLDNYQREHRLAVKTTVGVCINLADGKLKESAIPYVCVRDKKSSGTNGGSSSSGSWLTRDINEELSDAGGVCSVASNKITLDAGTYICSISAPAVADPVLLCLHQARLYNDTGSAVLLTGTNGFVLNGSESRSFIVGKFTLSVQSDLKVQHRFGGSYATYGLGRATSWGDEIYTVAEFWKVL